MRERRSSYKDHIRITLTGRITATFLLLVFFSLVAIGYGLSSLHTQTTIARRLVNNDTRAASLARDLQSELRIQERLAGQLAIRPNQEALELLHEKLEAAESTQREFLARLDDEGRAPLKELLQQYNGSCDRFLELLPNDRRVADAYFEETLRPQQRALFDTLKDFRDQQHEKINRALDQLTKDGDRAYQVTMILLLLGFALSTPVVLSVILRMHKSLRKLTDATQQIAEGNYDLQIDSTEQDEFGQLTREFLNMGHKLREYEILNLDANPLTHLPGNLVIQRRVEEMLRDNVPFAHAFVDLDHFKAYNDRYGYQKGSDVISMVGTLINDVITQDGNPDDFIGHIGGDDYIFLTTPERVEPLAQRVIEEFDRRIPDFYSQKDRETGSFIGEDRFGVEREFQIMTVSIAIICSDMSNYASAIALSHECAKMKEHLKRLPGSNYLIDRRKGVA